MVMNLKDNQIFVFGSNLAGQHIGGAAKQALEMFGAVNGRGEGEQGQSYAFPTLDENFNKLDEFSLKLSISNLYNYCRRHKDKELLLTKVGCGIAGFDEHYIKSLFKNPPKNLILPEDWTVDNSLPISHN